VPSGVHLINADARALGDDAKFDIVFQSTVLSSILDDDIQRDVASTMWNAVRPGGIVLSMDFIFNNPANTHVRAVPRARIAELFPGELRARRVLLAPPLARRVGWHPAIHMALRSVPLLRTHLLATVRKP
jgi:SAM-dependent methyltransferase